MINYVLKMQDNKLGEKYKYFSLSLGTISLKNRENLIKNYIISPEPKLIK